MWTRQQFEDAAAKIGADFLATPEETSINSLSCKVAQENGLNPAEVKTLVRLANVHTFEQAFDKKAGDDDRMIEFDVGDEREVLEMLQDSKTLKVAEYVDESYDFASDYFGSYGDEVEKVAEEEMPPRRIPLNVAKSRYQKAIEDVRGLAGQKEAEWHEKMAECVRELKDVVRDTDELAELEKEVLASFDSDRAVFHLRALHEEVTPRGTDYIGGQPEKVAHLRSHYFATKPKKFTPFFERFKQAMDLSEEYGNYRRAQEVLEHDAAALKVEG